MAIERDHGPRPQHGPRPDAQSGSRTPHGDMSNRQGVTDWDIENKASKERQNAIRDRRAKEKEAKDKYKAEKDKLQNSGSYNTKDARRLKQDYKDALADIDTSLDGNLTGSNDTINDGIDSVDSRSALPDTFEAIICVDGSPVNATIFGTLEQDT